MQQSLPFGADQGQPVDFSPEAFAPAIGRGQDGCSVPAFQPVEKDLRPHDFGSVRQVDLLEGVRAAAAQPAAVADADVVVGAADVDVEGLAGVAGPPAAEVAGEAGVGSNGPGR
ncbi:hypothetical protein [Streptomyces alfalfae]